jgi:hypothetical protein
MGLAEEALGTVMVARPVADPGEAQGTVSDKAATAMPVQEAYGEGH